MKTLYNIFLLFTCMCIGTSFVATSNETSSKDLDLKLLAIVGTKAYFVARQPQNWTEASASCKTAGMKQAKIEDEAEWNKLAGTYDETDFHHGHWTAGRDRQDVWQFHWDDNNADVPFNNFVMLFKPYYEKNPFLTCLALMVEANGQSYLTYFPCSQKLNVLCEMSTA